VFTQTYQQVGVTAAEANAAKAAAAVIAEKIAGEKLAQEQAAKAAAAKKLAAKEKALALTTLKPFDGPPASSAGGTSKKLTSNPCPSGAPDPLGCWHLNIQYNESFFSTGNTSEGDLLEGLCPTEEGFVIISGCGTINAAASGKEDSSEGGSSSPGASSDDPSDLLNLANLADGIVAKEAVPTPAEAQDLVKAAEPVESALKDDAWHRSAAFAADDIADNGTVSSITGGDGVQRLLIQAPGEVNGVAGRFEWILEGDRITHEMFVRGGTINGIPIKP
jgi:hypothetical protein